jgi:mRNA interferase MazF
MEDFVKGDVVVLNFPFSDMTATKKRPALVLAASQYGAVLCQITSQERNDPQSVRLDAKDFENGGLNIPSFIRTSILFTADMSLILYKAGKVKKQKLNEVVDLVCKMLKK